MPTTDELALLAHELRAPVAALQALTTAVSTAPPDARRRLVELAVEGGRDIARIMADPELRHYERVVVDLSAVIESVALADSERVDGHVSDGLTVIGDATRLRQALANLVANGLRHGTRVMVSADIAGDAAVVEVSDNGPGLPAGFDPFGYGVSGAGSTGLGLWLARRIAEAHGGTLDLAPAVRGARFRLVLPSSSGP